MKWLWPRAICKRGKGPFISEGAISNIFPCSMGATGTTQKASLDFWSLSLSWLEIPSAAANISRQETHQNQPHRQHLKPAAVAASRPARRGGGRAVVSEAWERAAVSGGLREGDYGGGGLLWVRLREPILRDAEVRVSGAGYSTRVRREFLGGVSASRNSMEVEEEWGVCSAPEHPNTSVSAVGYLYACGGCCCQSLICSHPCLLTGSNH